MLKVTEYPNWDDKSPYISWMGGLVEGEGSIFFTTRDKRWRLNINMNHRYTLDVFNELIYDIFKINLRVRGPYNNSKFNSDDHYVWELQGTKIVPILIAVLPFLFEKREKALLAIKHYEVETNV